MKKIVDFLKLWWGKVFKFTTKKNFVFIYPLIALILLVVVCIPILAFLLLIGWIITIVSNTQKSEVE
jgi:hypothetical protein